MFHGRWGGEMAPGDGGDCSLGRRLALSLAVAGFPRERREGAKADSPRSDRRGFVSDPPPPVAGRTIHFAKKGGPS